jgi:hypothetical protein
MWRDESGNCQQGAGFTRDISAGGIFVLSDVCPPEETQVWCEVMLPPLQQRKSMKRLRAAGPVLRISRASAADEAPNGFAIHGSPFVLTNEDDKEEWARLVRDQELAKAGKEKNI